METDKPKSLKNAAALEARLQQLNEAHVCELSEFVHRLRTKMGPAAAIPYFDPWDGGVEAEVLFLLEAPGPKALNSGFVSRNNPDETAKNFHEINYELGIDRKRTLIWNAVPWYIGTGQKIRPANSKDIAAGIESLGELMLMLPNLRAIVLVGGKAQKAENHLRRIAGELKIFKSPHPSPMFVNRKPENRNVLMDCWQEVKLFLDTP